MPTISEIQLLVKNVAALSNSLPRSVPNGTTKDKIWAIMHTQDGETMFETFNKRLDALFGEDCRDSDGHLYHIHQGKNGMGLICTYLNQIKWTLDIPLDLVKIKLPQLSFQQKAVETLHTCKVPDAQPELEAPHPLSPVEPLASSTTLSQSSSPSPLIEALNDLTVQSDNSSTGATQKRSISVAIDVDSTDDNDMDDEAQLKPSKKKHATAATLGNPTATDADGFLMDINVQAVDKEVKGSSRED
ncbi:hypothetical protein BJV77DRAFT_1073197 [Russula vinacea]|nr:hypothetical protein BJV77DRAFT_1073197 [Russula vinacea]